MENNNPETVETGGEGGIDIMFVTMATEPRSRVVTVQGCNITTSSFVHTSQNDVQLHTHSQWHQDKLDKDV